jgi:hypothetical protein
VGVKQQPNQPTNHRPLSQVLSSFIVQPIPSGNRFFYCQETALEQDRKQVTITQNKIEKKEIEITNSSGHSSAYNGTFAIMVRSSAETVSVHFTAYPGALSMFQRECCAI